MGLIQTVAGPVADRLSESSTSFVIFFALATFTAASIFLNVLSQVLLKNKNEPPLVFHWVPFIGSTVTYGIDPYNFFFSCRQKYGDCFTFILLGKKTTVFLGTKGNDFILNGKLSDLNAEAIYQPLTTPVFGKDVVYDCPNAKLMEQKKFVKYGLTTEAFNSYVPLIVDEALAFLRDNKQFMGKNKGRLDVPPAMSELTIYTATRTLQGPEVRSKFDSTFEKLFHDLDAGFQPINFMLPWAPLPQNRKRDAANKRLTELYLEIIRERKQTGGEKKSEDMIWNLMNCVYKNGKTIPEDEVAHMMIALLMAGQHSSSTTSSFILLRLAANPHIVEELLVEQKALLGNTDGTLQDLTYENLQQLPLHAQVVKETLRMHAPIHSIMRKVTNTMPIEGSSQVVPKGNTLLAAPGFTSRLSEFFPSPEVWDPHRWDAKPSTTSTSATNSKTNLPADSKTSTSSTTSTPATQSKPDAEKEEEKIDYGYGLVSKGTNSPYLPFGAGRHRCIGEQFAYLQLETILATWVRELRFRSPEDQKDIPGTDYSSLFSRPLRPAFLDWERREGARTVVKGGEKA